MPMISEAGSTPNEQENQFQKITNSITYTGRKKESQSQVGSKRSVLEIKYSGKNRAK